jgi:hypothetical protein
MHDSELTPLDALLREAAGAIRWPETPDLRASVMARVRASQPAPSSIRWQPAATRAGLAIAALVLIAALVVGVSRDARDAVADFLGLAVEGEEIHVLPSPAPGTTETPFPPPVPLDEIGTPVAREDAARLMGFEPAFPAGAGAPSGIYLIQYFDVPVLVLDYERFDLWESDLGVFQKFTKDVEQVEELTINGRPAYLIRGGPHIVRYVNSQGVVAAGSVRTVLAETLVWKGASTNYRLEFDSLTREQAIALAESLP